MGQIPQSIKENLWGLVKREFYGLDALPDIQLTATKQ